MCYVNVCVSFMDEMKFINDAIRGFRKLMILQLLCIKPSHGYTLIKEYKRITGGTLTCPQIYPFLSVLEEKGYVIGTWMAKGQRRIKIYKVTNKGKILLTSLKKSFQKPFREIILDLLSGKKKIFDFAWKWTETSTISPSVNIINFKNKSFK